MFYLNLAIDRVMAEMKDIEKRQYKASRPVEVTKGGGLWKDQPAVQTPSSHLSLVTDLEWLGLSAEEQ